MCSSLLLSLILLCIKQYYHSFSQDHSDFYFVHSYVIQPSDPTVIKGYADYGTMVPAIVEKDNVTACQFHPEKSGLPGLQLLKNFVEGV